MCMCVSLQPLLCFMRACTHVCTHACTHACTHTHTHTYLVDAGGNGLHDGVCHFQLAVPFLARLCRLEHFLANENEDDGGGGGQDTKAAHTHTHTHTQINVCAGTSS